MIIMSDDQEIEELKNERKKQEMLYGYDEEKDKSWLQKMVDYIKQKEAGSHKKLSDLA